MTCQVLLRLSVQFLVALVRLVQFPSEVLESYLDGVGWKGWAKIGWGLMDTFGNEIGYNEVRSGCRMWIVGWQ